MNEEEFTLPGIDSYTPGQAEGARAAEIGEPPRKKQRTYGGKKYRKSRKTMRRYRKTRRRRRGRR